MKKILILLLLISLAAHSRVKIDIVNGEGQPMVNEFDTQAEADAYILKVVERGDWGQASWTETDCGNSFKTRTSAMTGNSEYLCADNFTVTITDITLEHAQKVALRTLVADMDFGRELYAKIRLMIAAKGLTTEQRKTFRTSSSSIRDDLFDGDICSARESIDSLPLDSIVTAEDKTQVFALMDAYKTCP